MRTPETIVDLSVLAHLYVALTDYARVRAAHPQAIAHSLAAAHLSEQLADAHLSKALMLWNIAAGLELAPPPPATSAAVFGRLRRMAGQWHSEQIARRRRPSPTVRAGFARTIASRISAA